MKKLLYSILALAGVVATSCTQEHIDVTYDPAKVDAPVINSVTGGDLSTGADVAINYSEVNYNQPISDPVYSLYAAKADSNMADKVKISIVDFSKATEGEDGSKTIAIPAKTMNNLLVKTFKAAYGEQFGLEFQIEAAVKNEKGTAVAGTEVYSNIASATFVPFEAKEAQPDKDEFSYIWVIGDYCGWSHDKTQFLYDYSNDATTFSGVVDFGAKAANGFKITGKAGWDDSCNWGLEDNSTAAEEASSLQLISSGGSQDIKCYSKRYYKFSFDKTSLVLTKDFGFDSLGIIGVGGDWDNDKVQMEFNPLYCRFYADVTFAAGDEFKVRADGGWNLNWGVDAAAGGDNVKVADAGNYRVYLSLNKGTLEINAEMYGKDEPGAGAVVTPDPEPEVPVTEPDRWGVVGTLTGWGGSADLYMSEVGENLFVRANVTLAADDQFKVRYNNGWDINAGAAGDVEPFAVTVGEELTLVGGGKNLSAPAGTYDIYFNADSYKMWVMNPGETPGGVEVKSIKIYGDLSATGWTNANAWIWDAAGANYTGGNWPGLALNAETVDGKEYYVFDVTPEMMGKTVNVIFNNGSEQTVDINGVELNDNVIITLTEKGGDGKWLATVNGQAPAEPEKPAVKEYGLVGSLTSWGDSPDIKFTDAGNGCYTLMGQPLTTEDKFKVRLYGQWVDTDNYGLETAGTVNINEAITLISSGGSGDMNVAVAGIYDLYFFPADFTLYVMTEGTAPEIETPAATWTVQGDVNNTQWGTGIATELVDGLYVAKNITFQDSYGEGANFKVLKDGTWMGSVAGGKHELNTAIAVSADAGANINMNVAFETPYDIYIDGANNNVYVVEAGATPSI